MKMIVAIVSRDDSLKVARGLTKENFSVTRLATTGGFLMAGNTTLLIGTDDEKVPAAIEIIRTHSQARKEMLSSTVSNGVGMFSSTPVEVIVGGATVFVLNIEQFEKL